MSIKKELLFCPLGGVGEIGAAIHAELQGVQAKVDFRDCFESIYRMAHIDGQFVESITEINRQFVGAEEVHACGQPLVAFARGDERV